eukprot:2660566-Alexandrium_andersonii.AAC.1
MRPRNLPRSIEGVPSLTTLTVQASTWLQQHGSRAIRRQTGASAGFAPTTSSQGQSPSPSAHRRAKLEACISQGRQWTLLVRSPTWSASRRAVICIADSKC